MNKPIKLYDLLPFVYQLRDAEDNLQLRSLLEIVQREIDVVQDDIQKLYDNWFIETCQDWVVPYLGQLVGVEPEPGAFLPESNPRSGIGDAIRFGRRRGSLGVLSELANDLGFSAHAVEFEKLCLQTTAPSVKREGIGKLVDFFQAEEVELLGTPFCKSGHLLDFRTPSTTEEKGWYHPDNLGLFVWKSITIPMKKVTPKCIGTLKGKYGTEDFEICLFSFDPSGAIRQLYVNPTQNPELQDQEWRKFPIPLERWMLSHDISASIEPWDSAFPCDSDGGGTTDANELLSDTDQYNPFDDQHQGLYGPDASVCIFRRSKVVPPHEIFVTDLSSVESNVCKCQDRAGNRRSNSKLYLQLAQDSTESSSSIAIDPETGLFAFIRDGQCTTKSSHDLRVSFYERRPRQIGGGQYQRGKKLSAAFDLPTDESSNCLDQDAINSRLSEQIVLETNSRSLSCIIAKVSRQNSHMEVELVGSGNILLFEGNRKRKPKHLRFRRKFNRIMAANGSRPRLYAKSQKCGIEGKIIINKGSAVVFDGLIIDSSLSVEVRSRRCAASGSKTRLVFRDCTIGNSPNLGNAIEICGGLDVLEIENSILGPIKVDSRAKQLTHLIIRDSILTSGAVNSCSKRQHSPRKRKKRKFNRKCSCNPDLVNNSSLFGPANLQVETIERSTILGSSDVFRIKHAANSIFNEPVKVNIRVHQGNSGEVDQFRFCYVQPNSEDASIGPVYTSDLPEMFRCQPMLAYQQSQAPSCASATSASASNDSISANPIAPKFFEIEDLFDAGFAQLSPDTSAEILRGSDANSEMGAFHSTYSANRISRLDSRLREFTPIGKKIIVIDAESLEQK